MAASASHYALSSISSHPISDPTTLRFHVSSPTSFFGEDCGKHHSAAQANLHPCRAQRSRDEHRYVVNVCLEDAQHTSGAK